MTPGYSSIYQDWQKNAAPRRRRHLIKPPGRYA